MNAYNVVRDLEKEICNYTGAPFCVTTNSCTMALTLAVAWHLQNVNKWLSSVEQKLQDHLPQPFPDFKLSMKVEIPKRTYVGVPYAIIEAGGRPAFRDQKWSGWYPLLPLPVWDSARWFTSGMYLKDSAQKGQMVCCSFHASKILADTQGGCILHDNPEADAWLRRARFDGRTEGVAPKDDTFTMPRAWHCYMSPDVAARLLLKLSVLSRYNDPLPNDAYPDLSTLEIFR